MVGAGKEGKRQVCEEGGTLSPARLRGTLAESQLTRQWG